MARRVEQICDRREAFSAVLIHEVGGSRCTH